MDWVEEMKQMAKLMRGLCKKYIVYAEMQYS